CLPGQVVGICGPNGAGKTTLLRAMAGLIPLAAGDIFLLGKPIGGASLGVLADRRAFVPQTGPHNLPLTAAEVVALGRPGPLHWGRAPRAAIMQALEAVELEHSADCPMATLSLGQQGRVRLAQALLRRPKVALLDEPASHQDLRQRARLMHQLRRCAAGGDTVVLSLHDLSLASLMCDVILLLQAGGLVACGTPQEVLRREVLEPVFATPLCYLAHPHLQRPLVELSGETTLHREADYKNV
ncbi:MAG: ABC transporter ATP-binding protein, partial [Deltaproteobacteria bacterium]